MGERRLTLAAAIAGTEVVDTNNEPWSGISSIAMDDSATRTGGK
jgi:hypothetical protein